MKEINGGIKVYDIDELDEQARLALSTYKYPSAAKLEGNGKPTNAKIQTALYESMGWDAFVGIETDKYCELSLSDRQRERLGEYYHVALSDVTENAISDEMYVTVWDDKTSFREPIFVKKTNYMTKKELMYLLNIFG